MKRSELEYDVRYALRSERTGLWQPVYVIGKEWLKNGTYTGNLPKKSAGRGGAVLAVVGVGDWEPTEQQALGYTDARHIALTAVIEQMGDQALTDAAILFPADGWQAMLLGDQVYSRLVTWEEAEAEDQRAAREAAEKFTTLRKFRTVLLKTLRAADGQRTLGGMTLTVAPPEKVVDDGELKKAKAEARRLKKRLDAIENPKALDEAAVTNYGRALKIVEDWFIGEEHVAFPTEGARNIAAHDLLLKIAAVLVDEPRQLSNRAKTFEVGAAKTALWERWRKGSDGNGYDWLGGEDQDPAHVIDVIVSTLMARGWEPKAVES